MDRWAVILTDRRIDRQTDEPMGRWTDGWMEKQTDSHIDNREAGT
jgi:hypothetical protein